MHGVLDMHRRSPVDPSSLPRPLRPSGFGRWNTVSPRCNCLGSVGRSGRGRQPPMPAARSDAKRRGELRGGTPHARPRPTAPPPNKRWTRRAGFFGRPNAKRGNGNHTQRPNAKRDAGTGPRHREDATNGGDLLLRSHVRYAPVVVEDASCNRLHHNQPRRDTPPTPQVACSGVPGLLAITREYHTPQPERRTSFVREPRQQRRCIHRFVPQNTHYNIRIQRRVGSCRRPEPLRRVGRNR